MMIMLLMMGRMDTQCNPCPDYNYSTLASYELVNPQTNPVDKHTHIPLN